MNYLEKLLNPPLEIYYRAKEFLPYLIIWQAVFFVLLFAGGSILIFRSTPKLGFFAFAVLLSLFWVKLSFESLFRLKLIIDSKINELKFSAEESALFEKERMLRERQDYLEAEVLLFQRRNLKLKKENEFCEIFQTFSAKYKVLCSESTTSKIYTAVDEVLDEYRLLYETYETIQRFGEPSDRITHSFNVASEAYEGFKCLFETMESAFQLDVRNRHVDDGERWVEHFDD